LSEIGAAATLAEPPFGPSEGWQSRGEASSWALPVVLATSPIDDLAIFSNPAWQMARRERESKVAQQAKLVRYGAAAACALLFLSVPVVLAKRSAAGEKKQLTSMQAKVTAGQADISLAQGIDGGQVQLLVALEEEPDWTLISETLETVRPSTISLGSVDLQPDGTGGVLVKIDGNGSDPTFSDVLSWIETLEYELGVDINVPNIGTGTDGSAFTADFRFPSISELEALEEARAAEESDDSGGSQTETTTPAGDDEETTETEEG
jgi:hypothetical protein